MQKRLRIRLPAYLAVSLCLPTYLPVLLDISVGLYNWITLSVYLPACLFRFSLSCRLYFLDFSTCPRSKLERKRNSCIVRPFYRQIRICPLSRKVTVLHTRSSFHLVEHDSVLYIFRGNVANDFPSVCLWRVVNRCNIRRTNSVLQMLFWAFGRPVQHSPVRPSIQT